MGCLLGILGLLGALGLKAILDVGSEYVGDKIHEHQVNNAIDENENKFIKLFAFMAAKIALADGYVSEVEREVFYEIFQRLQLPREKFLLYKNFFNQGLSINTSIYSLAQEFSNTFDNIEINTVVYHAISFIASADDSISKEELKILRDIPSFLNISSNIFYEFCERAGIDPNCSNTDQRIGILHEKPETDPYETLGASKYMSDDELKKIYREKIKKYHPDILRGQGVPEEMLKFANDEIAKLNSAWEQIKEERGIA